MKIENLQRAGELATELNQMEAALQLLKKNDSKIVVESADGNQRAELPHTRFFYDTLIKAKSCMNAIKNEIKEL